MNFRIVFNLISYLIALEGLSIALSAGVAALMRDSLRDVLMLLCCGIFTALAGGTGILLTRKKENIKPGLREGFAVVALGWLLISLFGSLPFIAVTEMHWYDAVFETISGFSTTGASVIGKDLPLMNGKTLPDGIESLSYGILFWRCLTHWIGGMGIVVFSLAILPVLGIGGQALYNAEVPGVKTRDDHFTPRIASTAKILWLVYLGLTVLETLLLFFGGMPLFDAICHSFSTISTGGFANRNDSIAFYQSSYIQLVFIVFMFLGGCNFILHFRALTGLPLKDYLNEEFRTYALILLGAALSIGTCLFFSDLRDPVSGDIYFHSPLTAFRAALFQVVSISTTTGFITADFAVWPSFACVIILGLMCMGGCGGSTSGGIKCVRIILLWKFSVAELRRSIFPRVLNNIRLNGERVMPGVINRVLGFFLIYMFTVFLFMILLTCCCRMDILTAVTASISCLSNCGPAFGALAPDCTFAWLNVPAKLLLALEMLTGRLELYTVLIFFLPSFWKK